MYKVSNAAEKLLQAKLRRNYSEKGRVLYPKPQLNQSNSIHFYKKEDKWDLEMRNERRMREEKAY